MKYNPEMIHRARVAAETSNDPSTQVGAIVTDYTEFWCEGVGYNDLAPGSPPDWWHDRKRKYDAVIHAEVRALAKAEGRGHTIYVTHYPCKECAKVIIAAGIKKVVCPLGPWRDDPAVIDSVAKAASLFRLARIEVVNAV